MSNKAHTAAVRRITTRYRATAESAAKPDYDGDQPDVVLADGRVDVETSATLAARIGRLKAVRGRRFVAVTNKETLEEAVRLAAGTGIGVMNSRGDIILDAAN